VKAMVSALCVTAIYEKYVRYVNKIKIKFPLKSAVFVCAILESPHSGFVPRNSISRTRKNSGCWAAGVFMPGK
jgi:hypothetical protein